MMSQPSFQKTRIAPTPSGYLHMGNALSFSLTAALAQKYSATILLRIDDLDQQRVNIDYVEDIFATLSLLGIQWQEGPHNRNEFQQTYSQLKRVESYEAYLRQLVANKQVYACTCSRSAILQRSPLGHYDGYCRAKGLPLDTPQACWRLYTDREANVLVNELYAEPLQQKLPIDMYDFVVRKKDGLPAYQLASLADDCYYGIDLIVRGKDLWASTIAQLYLARLLNKTSFLDTTFVHHSLLLTTAGEKMSKSVGDTAVKTLREQGVSASELFKHIAKGLGVEGTPTDYISLAKLVWPD